MIMEYLLNCLLFGSTFFIINDQLQFGLQNGYLISTCKRNKLNNQRNNINGGGIIQISDYYNLNKLYLFIIYKKIKQKKYIISLKSLNNLIT